MEKCTSNRRWFRVGVLALVVVLAAGCRTLDYRTVQAAFDVAAQADNNTWGSGFTETNPATDPGYQPVLDALTDARIGKLDARVQANAWLLRAVSEWRVGQFTNALGSAQNGLGAGPRDHSRDKILLSLLPALVIDSEIKELWRQSGRVMDTNRYSRVERDYATAFQVFDRTEAQFGPGTPPSTQVYCLFQRWRALHNWQTVILSLQGGESAQAQAFERAKSHFQGRDLDTVATETKAKIPAGHPLHQLIESLERGL